MVELSVSIWCTMQCNFCCTYCYEKDYDSNQISMSLDTAGDVVRYLEKYMEDNGYTKCKIHFHGGEPLLNFQIIEYIVNLTQNSTKSFDYEITTNASILDENIIDFLYNNNFSVAVSLDGTQETFSLGRKSKSGHDEYNNVVNNVHRLQKRGCSVSARMTVVPQTAFRFFENVSSLISNGMKKIDVSFDYENSIWERKDYEILVSETLKVQKYIKEKCEEIVFSGPGEGIPRELSKCNGGISTFSISCEGYIYPCIFVFGKEEFKIGNIVEGISPNWKEKIEKINQMKMIECEGCSMLPLCFSNKCRMFNYKVNHDYTKPSDNVCAMNNYYKLELYKARNRMYHEDCNIR